MKATTVNIKVYIPFIKIRRTGFPNFCGSMTFFDFFPYKLTNLFALLSNFYIIMAMGR